MKSTPLTRRAVFASLALPLTLPLAVSTVSAAVCSVCRGSGTGAFRCSFCNGSGLNGSIKCSFCNGRGLTKCTSCNGTGQR